VLVKLVGMVYFVRSQAYLRKSKQDDEREMDGVTF
jgi:hypothetical protein